MLLELKEVWRTKRKAEKSSRSKCVPRRERVLHEDRGIDGGISDTDPRAAMSRVKVVGRQLRGYGQASVVECRWERGTI